MLQIVSAQTCTRTYRDNAENNAIIEFVEEADQCTQTGYKFKRVTNNDDTELVFDIGYSSYDYRLIHVEQKNDTDSILAIGFSSDGSSQYLKKLMFVQPEKNGRIMIVEANRPDDFYAIVGCFDITEEECNKIGFDYYNCVWIVVHKTSIYVDSLYKTSGDLWVLYYPSGNERNEIDTMLVTNGLIHDEIVKALNI